MRTPYLKSQGGDAEDDFYLKYGTCHGLTDAVSARLDHMTDQHNALADTVHGMREQVGNVFLAQQALHERVDKLDAGLASVVDSQQAATAATHCLGSQIQELLGRLPLAGPCAPPGQGSSKDATPAATAQSANTSDFAAAPPGVEAPTPAGDGRSAVPPSKAAGKGAVQADGNPY